MKTVIDWADWRGRGQMIQWLEENVGPIQIQGGIVYGTGGEGWTLQAETYEDPYAMIELLSGNLLVEIDDEEKMMLFLLRWC